VEKEINIWTSNEVEMSGQVCTYNDHLHAQAKKEKTQAILTVLGEVVWAKRLPERFQLHLTNWTFHNMER
jgi:hypothetical protein